MCPKVKPPLIRTLRGVKCPYSERVEFRENVGVFLSQGQNKLPVIMIVSESSGV